MIHRCRAALLIALMLTFGLKLLVIWAAGAGDLDPSFGGGGIVTTAIGPGNSDEEAWAIIVQPDSKLVAAGLASRGSDSDFALVRYNVDGSLDSAFGSGGIVITPIGGSDSPASAQALVLQPDGKLVAAGYSHDGTDGDFAVVRYNADGSLDSTFDSDGIVITPINNSSQDAAFGLVLQPDGKLVAAGHTFDGSNHGFAVVRYNADGSLDSTFDSDGIVITPINSGLSYDAAYDLVLQPDGKLVAVGTSGSGDFALIRYHGDGSLDSAFGSGGIVLTPVGSGDSLDFAAALALQPDGKLVAAGLASGGSDSDFALVRYNADGSPDSTFGSSGIVLTPVGSGSSYDAAFGLVLQADGKLVAAGNGFGSSDNDFALVRYNADGSPDNTFGSSGIIITPIGSGDDFAYALVLQPDGKLVAAGRAKSGLNSDFALVRYLGDSSPAVDVAMSQQVTPIGPVVPGQMITYTLIYQNFGLITATGVTLTDILPVEVTNLSYSSSGASLTPLPGLPYTWQAADLDFKAGGIITITGQISPNLTIAARFTSTASISTTTNDANVFNNDAAVGLNVILPQLSLTAIDSPTESGPTDGSFRLNLNPAPMVDSVVNFSLSGAADSSSDYHLSAGSNVISLDANSFSVAAGSTTASINLTPVDDDFDEVDETAQLILTAGTGYEVIDTNNQATLTILDDDSAGLLIILPSGHLTATEGTEVSYQLHLTSQPTAIVTVSLTSDGQTSLAPTHVSFIPTNWDQPQIVTVTALDDGLNEGSHSGQITHSFSSTDPNYQSLGAINQPISLTDPRRMVYRMISGGTSRLSWRSTPSHETALLPRSRTWISRGRCSATISRAYAGRVSLPGRCSAS